MGLISLLRSPTSRIILSISIVIAAILYHDELHSLYNTFREVKVEFKNDKSRKVIFTEDQIKLFNGVDKKQLYLALTGLVFDVTKGKVHYGQGQAYNYFVGKDGSRSFITGSFQDESDLRDHVIDRSCDELFAIIQWRETFKQKYKYVGVLIGRYYDEAGEPTAYSNQLNMKIEQCQLEKERAKSDEQKYPPCNVEWSAEHGSRVWCTKSSGGVLRGWAGVPRQLFTPGEDKPRCVCINLHKDNSLALLKEYDNCKPDSESCVLV